MPGTLVENGSHDPKLFLQIDMLLLILTYTTSVCSIYLGISFHHYPLRAERGIDSDVQALGQRRRLER